LVLSLFFDNLFVSAAVSNEILGPLRPMEINKREPRYLKSSKKTLAGVVLPEKNSRRSCPTRKKLSQELSYQKKTLAGVVLPDSHGGTAMFISVGYYRLI
jgi:hypothetical protein